MTSVGLVMYLKQQINHPIKLNFFKKLFLLTLGIVFLTIIISFIFNYLFYDKFYIHRKQDEILKIRTQIVSKIENPDELKNYITFAEDSFGVKIDLNIIQNNKKFVQFFCKDNFLLLKIKNLIYVILVYNS